MWQNDLIGLFLETYSPKGSVSKQFHGGDENPETGQIQAKGLSG